MTTSRLWLTAVAVLAAAGCGSGISPPRSYPVSGSVTAKGKPAAGIRVTLHPQFDIGAVKYTPYGETGKDGRFVLSTGAANNGAPAGEYVVTLTKPRGDSDRKTGLDIEVDDLKGKYSDPAKSTWKVTIKSGENVLDPFSID